MILLLRMLVVVACAFVYLALVLGAGALLWLGEGSGSKGLLVEGAVALIIAAVGTPVISLLLAASWLATSFLAGANSRGVAAGLLFALAHAGLAYSMPQSAFDTPVKPILTGTSGLLGGPPELLPWSTLLLAVVLGAPTGFAHAWWQRRVAALARPLTLAPGQPSPT